MRTRTLSVFGALCVVAAVGFLVAHNVVANDDGTTQPTAEAANPLELVTLNEAYPIGSTADLLVSVPPEAVGGQADLFAIVGDNPEYVMSFPVVEPVFVVGAPVPTDPALIGQDLTYRYVYSAAEVGMMVSQASNPQPTVDPEPEE